MSRSRIILVLVVILVGGGAVLLTVRNWAGVRALDVKPVPAGHQEIAWLAPATSGEAWERLVAAMELLQMQRTQPLAGLRVDLANAFLPLTADVPEIALYFDDNPGIKLWIRWYKLSSENPSPLWLERFKQRGISPLAILGGDTSDRALFQCKALEAMRKNWPGPAPLYLITTATADRYDEGSLQTRGVAHSAWPKLMEAYPKRTFRFCFTNARMAEAVLDFVHQNRLTDPAVDAAAVSVGNPFGSLGFLSVTGLFRPYYSSTWIWKDDSYSKDLGEIFLDIFARRAGMGVAPFKDFYNNYIDYSVGGFAEPNPSEALQVGVYLANNLTFRDRPQLLALPTGAQPARRFLRALCRRAPMETRNAVVVTGDSVTFNSVYRDHNVAWNVQDMPVPLVFFSHRDPIDEAAGFGAKASGGTPNQTGTQDVLLYRDIVETLVEAAFKPSTLHARSLVPNADALLENLRHTRWRAGHIQSGVDSTDGVAFFDAAGNRQTDTGEHIVWLRPVFDGSRILPEAYITIWRASGAIQGGNWQMHGPPLHVQYDQPVP